MAIPVYLQQFKAAGIYRVVFDKSTILNVDTEILRLVVGYSEAGPFNIPTYIESVTQFKSIYGNISKKLEKRGVYFHRLALQALTQGPILCLNLKKFSNEKVDGATISTDFNPSFTPIDTVKLYVEDIYDTTRFWELSAEKMNGFKSIDGTNMDSYINICTTDTKKNSGTYFIRKASGKKVNGYNITVSDWYANEEMPEYLEPHKNCKISDFFAEIYVFNGKFKADQVLASSTLKNYFIVSTTETDEYGDPILTLRDHVTNAFGEWVDTLDALYNDSASNAINHYVGCLIPYFKDKNGVYQSLDILFNNDRDDHRMMMSFNTDLLDEEEVATIDISGKDMIVAQGEPNYDEESSNASGNYEYYKNEDGTLKIDSIVTGTKGVSICDIYNGTAKTTLLGNIAAPVIADKISFSSEAFDSYIQFNNKKSKVVGELYVSNYSKVSDNADSPAIELTQVRIPQDLTINKVSIICESYDEEYRILAKLGAVKVITASEASSNGYDYKNSEAETYYKHYVSGQGTYFDVTSEDAYAFEYHNGNDMDGDFTPSLVGPQYVITSIAKIESTDSEYTYTDVNGDMRVSKNEISVNTSTELTNGQENSVYNASVTFIPINTRWRNWLNIDNIDKPNGFDLNTGEDTDKNTMASELTADEEAVIKALAGDAPMLISDSETSLINVCHEGDCFLAWDGTADMDGDGLYPEAAHRDGDDDGVEDNDKDDAPNGYYDIAFVQETGSYTLDSGRIIYYVIFTAMPVTYFYTGNYTTVEQKNGTGYVEQPEMISNILIRVDNPLNQEMGTMTPQYLQGYTYQNDKPESTSMKAKLDWQDFMLSALTEYKGLRTGLLNKSDIDYRYIVDTFESFPTSECKSVLSYLAKQKQSAFAILNFPSVKTFRKCPYTSFVDSKGVFDVNYVVAGYNKKKASTIRFSLPTDSNGASFCAFYTPLKFSDGYVDTIVPSAGLVSNLFMKKYSSRQPYYIIAGPNYGAITATDLVGPDYKYSMDELQIIEPYGVNCMVYRPSFGTFINANQTAKQSPKSALSAVNVRELVIYLQDEIEKLLQSYQWEFNNQTVRNAIKDKADAICTRIQANGGIQDFLNVMDESNNTPDIIDNEMAILDTHIEPGRGMGKMVQQLTLYSTGKMRSMISE